MLVAYHAEPGGPFEVLARLGKLVTDETWSDEQDSSTSTEESRSHTCSTGSSEGSEASNVSFDQDSAIGG
jgi:hypothetical protein